MPTEYECLQQRINFQTALFVLVPFLVPILLFFRKEKYLCSLRFSDAVEFDPLKSLRVGISSILQTRKLRLRDI